MKEGRLNGFLSRPSVYSEIALLSLESMVDKEPIEVNDERDQDNLFIDMDPECLLFRFDDKDESAKDTSET